MQFFKLVIAALAIYAACTFLIGSPAFGADREMYLVGSGPDRVSTTKLGAMRALLSDASTTVYRCHQVEITEKATLKNKKKEQN